MQSAASLTVPLLLPDWSSSKQPRLPPAQQRAQVLSETQVQQADKVPEVAA